MLDFFRNLKFRTKLFIICLMISLIPTLILGSFCYSQLRTLLTERERTALRDSIIQESITISSQLDSYETISEYIVWDSNLIDVLSRKYDTNSQMHRAYTQTVEPFFSTLKHLSPDINEIVIYTDLEIYPRSGVLEPLSRIAECSWYSEVSARTKPLWIYSGEDDKLFVIHRFIDIPSNLSAYIQVCINYENLFSRLKSLFSEAYGILLLDDDGNMLWNFQTSDMEAFYTSGEQLSTDPLSRLTRSDFIVESTLDQANGWTYYVYRPTSVVLESTYTTILAILFIVIFCVFLVVLLSYWLSSSLVRPLENLAANMNQVSQGNYEIAVSYRSQDEVGQLIRSFTEMVQKLNHLINETLQAKIIRQKLEFRALQAQINPHLLYNTLSLINSQAIITGHPKIGLPARYLASFYRTSLNKGKDLITVKDELTNIQAYINIQLIMHSDSFDVVYHIEDEILSFIMPNLMLQPLVENAILHGIDSLNGARRGLLKITAKASGDTLVFTISDNGLGIPQSKLAILLTEKSNSYGIENVNTRARLQYGSRFGLRYDTQIDSGTTVTLTIPKQDASDAELIP